MNKCTRASTVFYKICCDNKFVCLFHKQNFGHTIYYTFQFQRKYFFSHKNWQMLFSFAKLKKNTKNVLLLLFIVKKNKNKWKVESGGEKQGERKEVKKMKIAFSCLMCCNVYLYGEIKGEILSSNFVSTFHMSKFIKKKLFDLNFLEQSGSGN